MPEPEKVPAGEVLDITILLRRDPSVAPARLATTFRQRVVDHGAYAASFGAASADASAVVPTT